MMILKQPLLKDLSIFIFRGAGRTKTSAAERAVLLDKLWATQMFRHPGHMANVIKNLEHDEPCIMDACRALDEHSLEKTPDEIVTIAHQIMPIPLGLLKAPGARQYHPYSFASKFLHWTTRFHFPIVDSYARLAVNKLQRESGIRGRVMSGCNDWKDDYPRWINFYGKQLLPSLSASDRDRLTKTDYDTQSLGNRCENSLLRVLDKVFYIQGRNAGREKSGRSRFQAADRPMPFPDSGGVAGKDPADAQTPSAADPPL